MKVFVFAVLVLFQVTVFAEETLANDKQVNQELAVVKHSPRDAVKEILVAITSNSDKKMSDIFDTSSSETLTKNELNLVIKSFPSLLNSNGTLLPQGLVTAKPEGTGEVGLPDKYEKLGDITIDNKTIPILLERLPRRGGQKWLISQETAFNLIDYSHVRKLTLVDRYTPDYLKGEVWRGAPVTHWVAIPVLLLIAVLCFFLLKKALLYMHERIQSRSEEVKRINVFSAFIVPISLIFSVMVFLWLARSLGLSILVRQDMGSVTVSVMWWALFIAIWSLLNESTSHAVDVLKDKNKVGGVSLVLFFRAMARVALIIIAVIIILDSYGLDVTTGIAAFGIGGIAIALGAQKAIENIVGSITIVTDQPFRVGDFCKIGNLLGTIESIGLRSTRIRTLADTVVTYPNGELSITQIENFTLRRRFLFQATLNLRYETSIENLEKIVGLLTESLNQSSWVLKDSLRVRFISYGATSKDVEIFSYIRAKEYAQFLERKEQLLYSFNEIIENNGSGFAFPSQTIYWAKDAIPKL